ncbi:MAG: PD-(D/E)XK nuclease-like domain-containing protein [Candidatus Pacebacteria bacterium]|nr:PD-(D/E)XK nuclease-like domain-containing protein [Candidatus Paceibacterota bacterium]
MIPGAYKLSFEDYLADPCPDPSLSRSSIVDLLDCPARAWFNHPRLNPQPPEEENETKFDIGKAAHDLLLEGGDSIFLVEGFDDWRKKEAQQARDAARGIGKTPLLEKQYETACQMAAVAAVAIRECTELGITNLRAEGDPELTYIWQEKNGIWCRCRPDWISKDRRLCLDVKTTGKRANPESLSRHISDMGYEIQSAFYLRGIKSIDREEPNFVFLFIEDSPPYMCSFMGLSLEFSDMGDQKVNRAIRLWRECLSSGKWPSYPNRICYADAPPWSLASWEIQRCQGEQDEEI